LIEWKKSRSLLFLKNQNFSLNTLEKLLKNLFLTKKLLSEERKKILSFIFLKLLFIKECGFELFETIERENQHLLKQFYDKSLFWMDINHYENQVKFSTIRSSMKSSIKISVCEIILKNMEFIIRMNISSDL